MRKILALLLLASFVLAANVTVDAPVKSVVLYSNGFSYMVRTGTAQLPGGDATLHIMNFTRSAFSSSISAADANGAISEIYNYYLEWNETKRETVMLDFSRILNASLNSDLSFTVGNSTRTATLVWYDSDRIGVLSNGAFSIYPIASIARIDSQAAQFSEVKETNVTKTEYGLAIREANASAGAHALNVGYLASGASWTPSFKFYLASEAASGNGTLQGWAEVQNNAGEDWNGINLTLVIGYPRIARYSSFYSDYARQAYASEAAGAGTAQNIVPQFTYAPFSSYIYYNLAYPATIKGGETRELPLFERDQEYEREYFWSTSNQMPEKVFILNNTGSAPRAAGIVSVYLNGEFLGEAQVGYTPKNQVMRVTVSDLPDIHTKKEEVNHTTRDEGASTTPGYPGMVTTTYQYRLTITNGMSEDITLRVNDQMMYGDTVRLVSSSVPVVQKPDNVLEWNVSVPKGQTLVVDYQYDVTNTRYY